MDFYCDDIIKSKPNCLKSLTLKGVKSKSGENNKPVILQNMRHGE